MLKLFFSLALLVTCSQGFASKTGPKIVRYCVPSPDINFNPFRKITDGKDMGYLLFTRSLISTDPKEEAILSAFEFSPDGSTFTGQINPLLKWNDNQPVSAREVALSIAKQLQFRPLGERVKIEGADNINLPNWETKNYTGIKILSDQRFTLKFISPIANLTGVIREAFSTNSRHNRFWISRLSDPAKQVLTKLPFIYQSLVPEFQVGKIAVKITNSQDCFDADATAFGDKLDRTKFNAVKATAASATSAVLNTSTLEIEARKSLAAFLRNAFQKYGHSSDFDSVNGFFENGENGYSGFVWPMSKKLFLPSKRTIKIAYEMPAYRPILDKAFKGVVPYELVALPSNRTDLDIQIIASSMPDGRQVILQDILKWTNIEAILKHAPKTTSILKVIATRSAATIPVDQITLKNFEVSSFSEASLIPLARRRLNAFTKVGLPICLVWSDKGELNFTTNPCEGLTR